MLKINNGVLVNAGFNLLGKNIKKKSSIVSSKITLTNNEIKDIIEVTKSLGNTGTLLKETIRRITSQEGGFFNIPRLLM